MSGGVVYRFGNFELEGTSGELRRGGVRLRLQGKPLQLLELLLEHAPQAVTREQMRERLWPADTFVDFDRNLNAAVKKLREALDDSAESPRFVETLPRRGYRFIAPVSRAGAVAEASTPPAFQAEAELAGSALSAGQRPAARALLVVALVAALVTTSFNPASAGREKAECPTRYTLAVLPFEHQAAEKAHRDDDHRWADGLTETLRVRLARWNPDRLGVISRRSAEQYRCASKTVADIGRELGVAYVVDGTVRRAGGRFYVTAEFVQVSDQTQLWSQTFEWSAEEVAGAEEQLVGSVLKAVTGCLTPAELPRVLAAKLPGESREP